MVKTQTQIITNSSEALRPADEYLQLKDSKLSADPGVSDLVNNKQFLPGSDHRNQNIPT